MNIDKKGRCSWIRKILNCPWYIVFKDIATIAALILIPICINMEQEKLKIIEVFSDNITGSYKERESAISLLSVADSKITKKLMNIGDNLIVKFSIQDFTSIDPYTRETAINELVLLHNRRSDLVINSLIEQIPDKINPQDYFTKEDSTLHKNKIMCIAKTFYKIGTWKGNILQKEKLEMIKKSIYYNDNKLNVKKFIDNSLVNFEQLDR